MGNKDELAVHLLTTRRGGDHDAIAPDGTPVVYFIGGPIKVKIGYTSSLKMRVNELWKRVGCPLELYAIAYGGRDLEREYHNRFAAHRLHGEWFVHCPEIADEISRLNSTPNTREGKGQADG